MSATPDKLFADARVTYATGALEEAELAPTPLEQFRRWYDDAVAAPLPEPNAMVVATVDDRGRPATRTVLLKDVTVHGFTFFTNRTSRKGEQLAANPAVALTFPWHSMQRQVSVRGLAVPTTDAETAAYFRVRPWGSRIGAWASAQSQPVATRDDLARAYEELAARYPDTGRPDDVPVPPFWGGYLVRPVEVEFWQGRPSRLHDRLVFVGDGLTPLDLDSASWGIERRQP